MENYNHTTNSNQNIKSLETKIKDLENNVKTVQNKLTTLENNINDINTTISKINSQNTTSTDNAMNKPPKTSMRDFAINTMAGFYDLRDKTQSTVSNIKNEVNSILTEAQNKKDQNNTIPSNK